MIRQSTLHVLLLRHGQTDANATGVIQGHAPTPLNDLGHRQARLLAERMGRWRPAVDVLVSSDLLRARQTAEAIGMACKREIVWDPAWRERNLGTMQGQTVGERETWRLASGDATPDGAESVAEFHERVADALLSAPARFAQVRTIAIVTHGGPIRSIMRMLADGRLPLARDHELFEIDTIPNCAITHLALDHTDVEQRWRVACLNDVAHLDGLSSTADVG